MVMIPPGLPAALAAQLGGGAGGGGAPVNAPDNATATAALARAIAAIHTFLDNEHDPQDRATASQCLVNLEKIRGNHVPGRNTNTAGMNQTPGTSGGGGGY